MCANQLQSQRCVALALEVELTEQSHEHLIEERARFIDLILTDQHNAGLLIRVGYFVPLRVRDQYGLLLLLDQLLLLKELVLELVITHVLVRRLKSNETI